MALFVNRLGMNVITTQDVEQILETLGPRDAEIQAVVQRSEDNWAVRFEDLDIDISLNPSSGVLELQVEIGEADRSNRIAVYANLLKYNLMKRDTGGVTIALTQSETVVQMLELHESSLSLDVMLIILRNFLTKARIFRNYILASGTTAEPDVELLPFMIRV